MFSTHAQAKNIYDKFQRLTVAKALEGNKIATIPVKQDIAHSLVCRRFMILKWSVKIVGLQSRQ